MVKPETQWFAEVLPLFVEPTFEKLPPRNQLCRRRIEFSKIVSFLYRPSLQGKNMVGFEKAIVEHEMICCSRSKVILGPNVLQLYSNEPVFQC